LNDEQRLEEFYRILENHKANGEDITDCLIEVINSYIKELNNLKIELSLQKQLKGDQNKEETLKDIKQIFEIIDCFQAQKELYEGFRNNIRR
jgi:hypothetical protein